MSHFYCPFCGQPGRKTREHVWARWLHGTPAARSLLENTHGERFTSIDGTVSKDSRGKYVTSMGKSGHVAKWLPNVTVWVCQACNGGWMKELEDGVKALLEPFLTDRAAVTLSAPDLRTLAAWATKSWMAYALNRPTQRNPFTESEYRLMAAEHKPLQRSSLWLMYSHEPGANVGIGIESTLLSFEATLPNLAAVPDNTAYAYLAVAGAVMVLLLVPAEAPAELVRVLSPPMLSAPMVRKIWPDLRPQYFPLQLLPDLNLALFLEFPPQVFEAIGLPVIGLTEKDTGEVARDFLAGANPKDLRQKWRGR